MFSLNLAAQLSIQLSVLSQVFAEIHEVDHGNILVSRGESVILICNTSEANITQVNWNKVNRNQGTFFFTYSISLKKNCSNITSHRVTIDQETHLKLSIFDAQLDDTGLYKCSVNSNEGERTKQEWNLTVSEEPEEMGPSWYFAYILTSVIGVLLCVFAPAACLCRKLRARTPNQVPVQYGSHLESGEEEVVHQPHGRTDRRTNNNRGSGYTERLNSIYDIY